MPEQMLSVPTPDGEMGAYVRRPDGDGPFPVIVYFHHGPGLDAGAKESMQSARGPGLLRRLASTATTAKGAWLDLRYPPFMRSRDTEGERQRR